jgi:hypothetical protein
MGEIPEICELDGSKRGLAELRLQIHGRSVGRGAVQDENGLASPEGPDVPSDRSIPGRGGRVAEQPVET